MDLLLDLDDAEDMRLLSPRPASPIVLNQSIAGVIANDVEQQHIISSENHHVDGLSQLSPNRIKPLELLDLPLDILREIVKEVTHTNDLTSLARCHSVLHRLTIPQIYSRFDIVWPDAAAHGETRLGVDALTYGLSTLVMAEEVFRQAPWQRRAGRAARQRRLGNNYAQYIKKFSLGNGPPEWVQQYLITRDGGKMLGTLVALAVARMRNLETFVWDMPTGVLREVWLALSSLAARDEDDENDFCHLKRVWIRFHNNSLHLNARSSTTSATAAVRDTTPPLTFSTVSPPHGLHHGPHGSHTMGSHVPVAVTVHHTISSAAIDRVEHPTFSLLPPLESLSVLQVDELPYLDEMSVLIARSRRKLKELRVGIARHSQHQDWVQAWDALNTNEYGCELPPANPDDAESDGMKRLGGVLGILVRRTWNPIYVTPEEARRYHEGDDGEDWDEQTTTSRSEAVPKDATRPPQEVYAATSLMDQTNTAKPFSSVNDDMSRAYPSTEAIRTVSDQDATNPPPATITEAHNTLVNETLPPRPQTASNDVPPSKEPSSIYDDAFVPHHTLKPLPTFKNAPLDDPRQSIVGPPDPNLDVPNKDGLVPFLESGEIYDETDISNRMLEVETLELERVPLYIPVLTYAFNLRYLTSLTLLHCPNHETFWRFLRKTYRPFRRQEYWPHYTALNSNKNRADQQSSSSDNWQYLLNLKKIHTNTVSPSLISFIRDCLAPNTLEVLLLQDTSMYPSPLTADAIFKGVLKRHRTSLQKFFLDSSSKGSDGHPSTTSQRWRRWAVSREILQFITSGQMTALKELGIAIDYKDWHFLLQRLPRIPHLRSLFLTHVGDYSNESPREFVLHVLDILILRPDMELCYIGIGKKCYEVLESSNRSPVTGRLLDSFEVDPSLGPDNGGLPGAGHSVVVHVDADDEDDDDDDLDDEDEDDLDDEEVLNEANMVHNPHPFPGTANAAPNATVVIPPLDPSMATAGADLSDTSSEPDSLPSDGENGGGCSDTDSATEEDARPRLRLREILFYDDRVAVFRARHGRL